MRKRIISTLLAFSMMLMMAACGAQKTTNEAVDTATQEVSVASSEVAESTVTEPTSTPTPEPTAIPTPTPEVDDGVFTIEDGMAKIDRLLEAHTVLLSQDKMLENHVQYDTESLMDSCFYLEQYTTADGNSYQSSFEISATAILYYDEYVNNNGKYYDFEEWLHAQEDCDTIRSYIHGLEEDNIETKNITLYEAIGLIAYLKDCETVEGVDLIETTEYTVSDVSSAYKITLACNGVNELEAVYDEEGNLLNIWPIEEDWNKYVSSFNDFTIEDGMAKIDRLLEAHTVLLSQGKTLEDYVQYDTENLTTECYELDQFTTADGLGYELNKAIWATAIAYYNEYVNNNGKYYDFEEWLKSQADDNAIVALVPGLEEESGSTWDITLFEAISLIAYLKSCDTVEGVELTTTDYAVSNVPGVYAITLACNGVNELEAIFDLQGNLLNIWPIEEDWNKYVSSFPDRDMEIK